MTDLLRAASQLLPGRRGVVLYWLLCVGLALAASLGLKPTPASGQLWGLPLRGFGMGPAGVLQDAYIEMLCHIWTVVWLPFACTIGLRTLAASYDGDFERFLRFGRRSGGFIECARVLTLVAAVMLFMVPFVAAALWGMARPGISWSAVRAAISACGGCTVLVSTIVCFLASCGTGSEVARAVGAATPFFLAGLSAFVDKSELGFGRYLPLGLPYSWETSGTHGLIACLVPAVLLIAVRWVATAKTRWIAKNSEGIRLSVP